MNSELNKTILALNLKKLFSKVKILVVGDVMLDKYWFGDTTRISPEAPVPITKIETTNLRAGGAANVARNIASLAGQVSLLAITGADQAANELEQLLINEHVDTHFVTDESISTTIKLRVIARNQQLIRLDFENTPGETSILELKKIFKELYQQFDIIILSDYDKGSLKHVSEFIQIAHQQQIPTLVDPKGNHFEKYQYATMLTPNRTELKTVIGEWQSESELTQKTQNLRKKLNLQSILVTRSEEGLSLYSKVGEEHQATVAKEVFDVSGAGDTVIAAIALSLGAKLTHQQLMRIANTAAGVVVAKVGTATCTVEELLKKLAVN